VTEKEKFIYFRSLIYLGGKKQLLEVISMRREAFKSWNLPLWAPWLEPELFDTPPPI